MSKKVSSLFITEGSRTHDTSNLLNCLKTLKNKNFKNILIPKFDKSIDDRSPKNKWQKITKNQIL